MFAQHTVTVDRPAARVAGLLVALDHPWTVALDGDGQGAMARVGVRAGGVPLYKRVTLSLGPALAGEPADRLMLPVSWQTVGGPPIFPRMEGTLHVRPAGAGCTSLTLNAVYDPPFGRLGEILDRALMYRLAGATVRDFVERVAARIEAELEA